MKINKKNRLFHLGLGIAVTVLVSGCTVAPSQQGILTTAPASQTPLATQAEPVDYWNSTAIAAPLDPEHSTLSSNDTKTTKAGLANAIEALPNQPIAAENITAHDLNHQFAAQRPQDLWQRIRDGFALPKSEHARTVSERRWYARHQEYIDRTSERAQPYLHFIVEEAARRNIPMELALLPVVESAFQPFAYSHGRASGIWQFIPGTGRMYGLKQNWWYDGRRDITASTIAAFDYLEALNRRFSGDWLLALAAYNSGGGTVRKAIRHNKRLGKPTDFWSLKLPRETRAYVPKLLAIRDIVATPEQHNITMPTIADAPYFEKVATGSQIDLARAAELAEIPLKQLYRLNPAFNRWATDPEGPHHLLIPLDKSAQFKHNLAGLPKENRVKWARHRIRNGETLGHIARRYKTTVAVIKDVNKVRGHMIRAGKNLIIPVAARSPASYSLSATQRAKTIKSSPKKGIKLTYKVQNGDTLWDISRAHNVGVRQLARWNAMAPRDTLRPGQKLVIWKSATKVAKNKTPDIAPALDEVTQRIRYVVRRGDSLSRISQRFNVSINNLKRWNPKARGKYLQPGQRLTLFVDITNQAGNI